MKIPEEGTKGIPNWLSGFNFQRSFRVMDVSPSPHWNLYPGKRIHILLDLRLQMLQTEAEQVLARKGMKERSRSDCGAQQLLGMGLKRKGPAQSKWGAGEGEKELLSSSSLFSGKNLGLELPPFLIFHTIKDKILGFRVFFFFSCEKLKVNKK